MKILVEGLGKVYTLIVPPYVLLWIAAMLIVLIIAKWHYESKKRTINFDQWKILHKEGVEYDNRKAEANRSDREGSTGDRQEKPCRKYEQPALH